MKVHIARKIDAISQWQEELGKKGHRSGWYKLGVKGAFPGEVTTELRSEGEEGKWVQVSVLRCGRWLFPALQGGRHKQGAPERPVSVKEHREMGWGGAEWQEMRPSGN